MRLTPLAQDVRTSIRALKTNRVYTATAVLTLTIGIATTTTIAIDAVLFRELPYTEVDTRDTHRIVVNVSCPKRWRMLVRAMGPSRTDHSSRRTVIGFSLEARRAGARLATIAMTASAATAPAYAITSTVEVR
jgi:hypothetical protein